MPFVDYTTEDELKKKQEMQTSAGQPTTQQSTNISANPSAESQVGSGKGSGFVNLQSYLNNNAGQGAATTQKVLDPKQDQIKSAVDGLNKEVETTKNTVNQGTVQRNTMLEDQIKNNAGSLDKNAYNSYVGQQYTGPKAYTPSLDTEKQWNGLPTQTSLQQVADPKTIGQQLKKENYTYGLGKLDSYLMNSEGGSAVDAYNTKNKDVQANRTAAVGGVNSAIKQAQDTSAANTGFARQAVTDTYRQQLAAAQAADLSGGYHSGQDSASAEINKRFADAGVSSPTGTQGFVSKNDNYSWLDAVSPEQLQALNMLADIDEDPSTNPYNKGSNQAVNVDWANVDSAINRAKSVQTEVDSRINGPVTVEEGATFTPTGDVIYDANGQPMSKDGLTADQQAKALGGVSIIPTSGSRTWDAEPEPKASPSGGTANSGPKKRKLQDWMF